MMTRGKQRLSKGTSATQGKATSVGAKRSSSTRSVPSVACKRSRQVPPNNGPVQTPHLADATHPAKLERQPLTGNSTTAVDRQELTTSLIPSSVSIPDLTKAVSAAVIKSLSEAGVIPSANTVPTTERNADPAAAVQESVAAVVQDLTGEGHNFQSNNDSVISGSPDANSRPGTIHKLISVPLASRVSEKLQSKIWANEYVDLGSLFATLPGDPKYNFTIKNLPGSSTPTVSLEPVQNTKRIATIDQWTSAFQIFVAIYTVRFPETAPALIKYSATVRDLAAKNAHWRYYDENFRYLRQKSLFPWDEIHWELWLQAHHMTRSSFPASPGNNANKQSSQPFPKGFCWKFHQGEKCFGCNFKHECFKCGATHPAFRCRGTKPSAATSRPASAHAATNTNQNK